MGRYQRGYICEAFGALHVRYRAEEIVDGKLVRKQRFHRLCQALHQGEKSHRHFKAGAPRVR